MNILFLATLTVAAVSAHNALKTPERFFGDATAAPISASSFPCGVPQDQFPSILAAAPISGTYAAGSTMNVEYSSSTNHNGGSCQFSLSYDDGTTWKVIQSIQGDCPNTADSASVELPANLPAGNPIFSWTWYPTSSGGPELYMSCSKISITSKSSSTSYLSSLPDMFVAVINSCQVDESPGHLNLMFPNPGANVVTSPELSSFPAGHGLLPGCNVDSLPDTSSTIMISPTKTSSPSSSTFVTSTRSIATIPTSVVKINAGVILTTIFSVNKAVPTLTKENSSPVTPQYAVSYSTCDTTYLACGQEWQAAGANGVYTCNDDYVSCRSEVAEVAKSLPSSSSPILRSKTKTATKSSAVVSQTTAKADLAVVMNVAGSVTSDFKPLPTALRLDSTFESSSRKVIVSLTLIVLMTLVFI